MGTYCTFKIRSNGRRVPTNKTNKPKNKIKKKRQE